MWKDIETSDLSGDISGLLRLGFVLTTEGPALSRLVSAFHDRYPDDLPPIPLGLVWSTSRENSPIRALDETARSISGQAE